MAGALAVDTMRALRLRAAGYGVSLLKVPEEITPQNRLLIGVPAVPAAPLSATRAAGGDSAWDEPGAPR